MWILEDKNGKKIELKDGISVTVGRNNTDILLTDDASISRSHAKLEVIKNPTYKKKLSKNNTKLIITDSKSKYGTFLLKSNKENRIDEKGYVASHMDRIRFGLQNYIFTIIYKPEVKYLVLTSGLTEKEKKDLEKILEFVGGKLCHSWNDNCTHLTTCTLGLTEKISCALASGIAIVNITFWKDVLKAQKANEAIPNADNYIPPFDNLLRGVREIALRPNPQRKQVFDGLIFHYFDEYQFKLYSTMIQLAGGKSLMFDESSYEKSDCNRDGMIFVQPLGDSESQNHLLLQYQAVNEQLKKCQLRSIPASEIPLAILYCSLDQHCNPKFKYTKLLQSKDKEKHMKIKEEKILVPETQDWDDLPGNNQHVIIPETVPESQGFIKSQSLNDEPFIKPTINTRSNVVYKRKEPSSSLDKSIENLEKRKKMDGTVTTAKTKDHKVDEGKNQSKKKNFESFDSIEEVEIKSETEIKLKTEIKEENDDEISKESVWDVFIAETPESDITIKTLKDDHDVDDINKEDVNAQKRSRVEERQSHQYYKGNEKKEIKNMDSIYSDDFDLKGLKRRFHDDDDDHFQCGQSRNEVESASQKRRKIEEKQPNQCYEDKEEIIDSIDIDEFDIKEELRKKDNIFHHITRNSNEEFNKNDDSISESIENNCDDNNYNDDDHHHHDHHDHHDDHDNDENQFSSGWIRTHRKKNVECRRDSVDQVETESGFNIKFISLTDLQGRYKPLQGKSFCKKKSPVPIRRLTKDDFYAWVPPIKNL